MKRIALLYTGITEYPTNQVFQLINRLHPQCEITAHVATWAGMNGPDFHRVFDFANIYEYDYTKFLLGIEAKAKQFEFLWSAKQRPKLTISMFCVWAFMRDRLKSIDCDFVIKVRVDNKMFFLDESTNFFAYPDKLSIPAGVYRRGGIADHVCFGKPSVVLNYLSVFDCLEEYAREGLPLNAEMLLRHHLDQTHEQSIERPQIITVCRNQIYNRDLNNERKESAHEEGVRKFKQFLEIALNPENKRLSRRKLKFLAMRGLGRGCGRLIGKNALSRLWPFDIDITRY